MLLPVADKIKALGAKPGLAKWIWGLAGGIGLVAISVTMITTGGTYQEGAAEGIPGSALISTGSLMINVFLKLGIVLLLLYGGVYLLRRLQSIQIGQPAKQLQVLETTHLSPRQKLLLVRAGDRTLLIGATDHTLSYLSEINISTSEDILPENKPNNSQESNQRSAENIPDNRFATLIAKAFQRE